MNNCGRHGVYEGRRCGSCYLEYQGMTGQMSSLLAEATSLLLDVRDYGLSESRLEAVRAYLTKVKARRHQ